jgi:hypothetical protein
MGLNPSHPSQLDLAGRGGRRQFTISDLPDVSQSYETAAEAVWHAIGLMEVARPRGKKRRRDVDTLLVLRRDLPYMIHETTIPDTQILVNRQYKPLGCSLSGSDKWVRYEDYVPMHIHLSQKQISAVVAPPYHRALFGDGCAPWHNRDDAIDYLKRLQRLHELLEGPQSVQSLGP